MVLSAAERILIDHGVTCAADIDLEAIAWSLGAFVKYRPMDGCEGVIVGSGKRAVISVNSRSSPRRQRFTIGHEIGHWHHHRGRVLFCSKGDIENPSGDFERQADNFASDLILPKYLFDPIARKIKKPKLDVIRGIADEFDASLTATIIKLVKTDLFPLVVVCHGKDRRKWFERSKSLPGWWFPREDLDPDSFAFDMLYGQDSEQTFPRKVGADAWFDFRNCDQYEILEQSFRLPNEEILTLLILEGV